jgi:hypothetical protein
MIKEKIKKPINKIKLKLNGRAYRLGIKVLLVKFTDSINNEIL